MISATGFWTFEGKRYEAEHVYDVNLSNALVAYAKRIGATKTYDFGCGPGKYVANFRNNGIDAIGFDGNPLTSNIPNCYVQDLTADFQLEPVNFLLCLEVCEHVPKQFENQLLKTIDRHVNPGGSLVLSWAVVGQPGTGHVNCQNNDYVINKFESMGYAFDKDESMSLRSYVSDNAPWFRNTTLVFKKR